MSVIASAEQMIEMLDAGEIFSWSRWSDAEWHCVLGHQGENCDGHQYFPTLGTRLKEILESKPQYYLSMQPLARMLFNQDPEFNRLYDIQTQAWGSTEILYNYSIAGHFAGFMEALERWKKDVVIIGNIALADLPFGHIVPIPLKNAWHDYARIESILSSTLCQGDLVLYCAGMMSEVLIDDFKDRGITQIDAGSVFDPYVGRITREYQKTLTIAGSR